MPWMLSRKHLAVALDTALAQSLAPTSRRSGLGALGAVAGCRHVARAGAVGGVLVVGLRGRMCVLLGLGVGVEVHCVLGSLVRRVLGSSWALRKVPRRDRSDSVFITPWKEHEAFSLRKNTR